MILNALASVCVCVCVCVFVCVHVHVCELHTPVQMLCKVLRAELSLLGPKSLGRISVHKVELLDREVP